MSGEVVGESGEDFERGGAKGNFGGEKEEDFEAKSVGVN